MLKAAHYRPDGLDEKLPSIGKGSAQSPAKHRHGSGGILDLALTAADRYALSLLPGGLSTSGPSSKDVSPQASYKQSVHPTNGIPPPVRVRTLRGESSALNATAPPLTSGSAIGAPGSPQHSGLTTAVPALDSRMVNSWDASLKEILTALEPDSKTVKPAKLRDHKYPLPLSHGMAPAPFPVSRSPLRREVEEALAALPAMRRHKGSPNTNYGANMHTPQAGRRTSSVGVDLHYDVSPGIKLAWAANNQATYTSAAGASPKKYSSSQVAKSSPHYTSSPSGLSQNTIPKAGHFDSVHLPDISGYAPMGFRGSSYVPPTYQNWMHPTTTTLLATQTYTTPRKTHPPYVSNTVTSLAKPLTVQYHPVLKTPPSGGSVSTLHAPAGPAQPRTAGSSYSTPAAPGLQTQLPRSREAGSSSERARLPPSEQLDGIISGIQHDLQAAGPPYSVPAKTKFIQMYEDPNRPLTQLRPKDILGDALLQPKPKPKAGPPVHRGSPVEPPHSAAPPTPSSATSASARSPMFDRRAKLPSLQRSVDGSSQHASESGEGQTDDEVALLRNMHLQAPEVPLESLPEAPAQEELAAEEESEEGEHEAPLQPVEGDADEVGAQEPGTAAALVSGLPTGSIAQQLLGSDDSLPPSVECSATPRSMPNRVLAAAEVASALEAEPVVPALDGEQAATEMAASPQEPQEAAAGAELPSAEEVTLAEQAEEQAAATAGEETEPAAQPEAMGEMSVAEPAAAELDASVTEPENVEAEPTSVEPEAATAELQEPLTEPDVAAQAPSALSEEALAQQPEQQEVSSEVAAEAAQEEAPAEPSLEAEETEAEVDTPAAETQEVAVLEPVAAVQETSTSAEMEEPAPEQSAAEQQQPEAEAVAEAGGAAEQPASPVDEQAAAAVEPEQAMTELLPEEAEEAIEQGMAGMETEAVAAGPETAAMEEAVATAPEPGASAAAPEDLDEAQDTTLAVLEEGAALEPSAVEAQAQAMAEEPEPEVTVPASTMSVAATPEASTGHADEEVSAELEAAAEAQAASTEEPGVEADEPAALVAEPEAAMAQQQVAEQEQLEAEAAADMGAAELGPSADGQEAAEETDADDMERMPSASGPSAAELDASVTRIQAHVRGHLARKQVAEMRAARMALGGAVTAVEAQKAAIALRPDVTPEQAEAAATRVQAHMRGHLARRHVAQLRAQRAGMGALAAPPAAAIEQPTEGSNLPEGVTLEQAEAAATLVQAHVRGHLARKQVEQLRARQSSAAAAEGAPADDAATAEAEALEGAAAAPDHAADNAVGEAPAAAEPGDEAMAEATGVMAEAAETADQAGASTAAAVEDEASTAGAADAAAVGLQAASESPDADDEVPSDSSPDGGASSSPHTSDERPAATLSIPYDEAAALLGAEIADAMGMAEDTEAQRDTDSRDGAGAGGAKPGAAGATDSDTDVRDAVELAAQDPARLAALSARASAQFEGEGAESRYSDGENSGLDVDTVEGLLHDDDEDGSPSGDSSPGRGSGPRAEGEGELVSISAFGFSEVQRLPSPGPGGSSSRNGRRGAEPNDVVEPNGVRVLGGKYEVQHVVGEGAYGMVLKCRMRGTDPPVFVAIKEFKIDDNDPDADDVKRTSHREVKVLQELAHPHVVQFIEKFMVGDRLFIVMEFLPCNLLELLEAQPGGMDREAVRLIMFQLCSAMAFIHSKGMMYRDIKPENLLVDEHGTVKLCDFGFARYAPRTPATRLTDYVATRWYRSPELLLGPPYRDMHGVHVQYMYTPSIDMWAIGCLMGELLDGEPLFAGDSDLDQMYRIQQILGPVTPHQQALFNANPHNTGIVFNIKQPMSLAARYVGKINSVELDFMQRLLTMDPDLRMTAAACLLHPYLADLTAAAQAMAVRSAASMSAASAVAGLGLGSPADSSPATPTARIASASSAAAATAALLAAVSTSASPLPPQEEGEEEDSEEVESPSGVVTVKSMSALLDEAGGADFDMEDMAGEEPEAPADDDDEDASMEER